MFLNYKVVGFLGISAQARPFLSATEWLAAMLSGRVGASGLVCRLVTDSVEGAFRVLRALNP